MSCTAHNFVSRIGTIRNNQGRSNRTLADLRLDAENRVQFRKSYRLLILPAFDSARAADTLAWAYYQYGSYDVAADLLQDPAESARQRHLPLPYWNGVSEAEEHTSREKTAATHFTTQSKLSRSGQDSQNLEPNELLSDNSPELCRLPLYIESTELEFERWKRYSSSRFPGYSNLQPSWRSSRTFRPSLPSLCTT
jgi:hypothetical protein